MTTVAEWVADQRAREADRVHKRNAAARARVLVRTAQFKGVCGQCRRNIPIGATVIQPYWPNGKGGNIFGSVWYCAECAESLQQREEKRGVV